VQDLEPLVQNPGIGSNDIVWIRGNPIDCVLQANAVRALRERVAFLDTDCQ
jgi:hypothetical protein